MIKSLKFSIYLIGGFVFLSACSTTPPSQLEKDFGKAYRNMVAEQIYNPDAALNPPANPPENLDGERAAGVIEKYRVDNTQQPQAPAIQIKLGN